MSETGLKTTLQKLWASYQEDVSAVVRKLQLEEVNPILQRRGWSLMCGNGTYLLLDEKGKQISWVDVDGSDFEDKDMTHVLDLLETVIPGYSGGSFIDPCIGAEMEDYPYPPQPQGGPQ